MFDELHQYLLYNKAVIIPGIGTFQIERTPAGFDHAARIIHPATYSIVLLHDDASPSEKFFHWLAAKLQRSEWQVKEQFADFANGVRQDLMAGNKLNWDKVGTLSKGLAGEVRFDSAVKSFTTEQPVAAIKILREKAEHRIRVGEDEKTSAEMIELLNPERSRRSTWWAAALIVALVALLFCIIYFAQKGINEAAMGNQQKLAPASATNTYHLVQ